jgi:hypothetical protein
LLFRVAKSRIAARVNRGIWSDCFVENYVQ